jgi:hypothetical protein
MATAKTLHRPQNDIGATMDRRTALDWVAQYGDGNQSASPSLYPSFNTVDIDANGDNIITYGGIGRGRAMTATAPPYGAPRGASTAISGRRRDRAGSEPRASVSFTDAPHLQQPDFTTPGHQPPALTMPRRQAPDDFVITSQPAMQAPTYSGNHGVSSISDALQIVKPYTAGTSAFHWLMKFRSYVNCRHIYGMERLELFRLLMVGDALEWIIMIDPIVFQSEETLYDAFQRRFGLSKAERWTAELKLYNTMQQDDQTIDSYVTAMKVQAFQLGIPESQLIKIISQNLKNSATKMFVLNKNCTTLNQLLEVGRTCEASKITDRPTTEQVAIANLASMVQDLKTELHKSGKQVVVAPLQIADDDNNDDYYASNNYLDQPQRFNGGNHQEARRPQTYQNQSFQARNSYQNNNRSSRPTYQPKKQPFQAQRQSQESFAKTRSRTSNQSTGADRLCTRFCGKIHAPGRDNCLAKGKTCSYCKKENHFQSVCQSKKQGRPAASANSTQ